MPPVTAWLGLGANLGDPEATLRSAVAALKALPGSRLVSLSSLYQSSPLGPPGQPDYLNAVASLQTALPPHELLAALHVIENAHDRVRQERWGARTLDLDLLLYGSDEIDTKDLSVPHVELKNRNFVLIPLVELWPEAALPDGTSLAGLEAARLHAGLSLRHSGNGWGN